MEEDFSKYNGEGTDLRKAQLRMLDILIEIDRICQKYNITYWLDFGTLIGAVRHNGFIPWDDDVDVSMMKKDYRKFLSVAKYELNSQFVIQNHNNERHYPFPYTKIVDTKTTTTYNHESYYHENCYYKGCWVDIFPVCPGNKTIRKFIDPLYGRCLRRVRHGVAFDMSVIFAYILYPFAILLKHCANFIANFKKAEVIFEYGVVGVSDYPQLYKQDYLPVSKCLFEGRSFPVPHLYDAVLKKYFGDYLSIPNAEDRITHLEKIEFID